METKFCITFNLECDLNNINSINRPGEDNSSPILPRYYEQEALRLIESIPNNVFICIVFLRSLEEYKQDTINYFMKKKNCYLYIKNSKIFKKTKLQLQLDNFKSGFWNIPLTGMLIEDYTLNDRIKRYNKCRDIKEENKDIEEEPLLIKFIKNDNDIVDPLLICEYNVKMDLDMYILDKCKFMNLVYKCIDSIEHHNKALAVIYYNRLSSDYGTDCKIREKYYSDPQTNQSNTCFIISALNATYYKYWYDHLIKLEQNTPDNEWSDLLEEVSFDQLYSSEMNYCIQDVQIGENYLCLDDIIMDDLDKIVFYHGPLKLENDNFDKALLKYTKRIIEKRRI